MNSSFHRTVEAQWVKRTGNTPCTQKVQQHKSLCLSSDPTSLACLLHDPADQAGSLLQLSVCVRTEVGTLSAMVSVLHRPVSQQVLACRALMVNELFVADNSSSARKSREQSWQGPFPMHISHVRGCLHFRGSESVFVLE